jgi:hypothetical protein
MACFGICWAIAWVRAVWISKTPLWVAFSWAIAVIGVVEAANYKLIAKAAFPAFRSAFERRALTVHPGERPHNEWIGIYQVDAIAADERGGVYFRISQGDFFIAHDSVGFAYRANSQGSPWGDSHYWLMPIDEDWCVFGGSTD